MFATIIGVLVDEEGAALVEYAILIALIAVACIGAVKLLGQNAQNTLNNAATAISA